MNGQWHAEDSFPSTTNLFCGEEPAEAPLGSTGTLRAADQIRELLGEDCELEASFLEDSWTSGRPITSASCRHKPNRAANHDEDVTFAEWNILGSFSFAFANGVMSDRPAYVSRPDSANTYSAAWLRDPSEGFASRTEDHASVHDAAGYQNAYGDGPLGSMTYLRACALLGVSEASTVTQVRTAYRRMVSKWHPDRMEQSGKKVRAFATNQMVVINEAYHFLREVLPAVAC
jgi:hypothetical protein